MLGQFEQAARMIEQNVLIFSQSFGPESLDVSMCLSQLGEIRQCTQQYVRARTGAARGATDPESVNLSRACARLHALVNVPREIKPRWDEAIKLYRHALRLAQKFFGPIHPKVASIFFMVRLVHLDVVAMAAV